MAPSVTSHSCCPIVEFRRYTLHPGKRDVLVDLFDREFVETQEAVGIRVIGQFRDAGDPNLFVFLRGFGDMRSRARALADFYQGPVWTAHREAANATMIDWSNVLLLRPALAGSEFSLDESDRPRPGVDGVSRGLVVATVYYFDRPPGAQFTDFFETALRPVVTGAGSSILACFVTESSPNDYPALPVREGEHAFVWFSRFPEVGSYGKHLALLSRSRGWSEVTDALATRLKGPPEIHRLLPTARSLLHG